jgi:hypothetical protein
LKCFLHLGDKLIVQTSVGVYASRLYVLACRFVDRAVKLGSIPLAIINSGETRADKKQLPIAYRSSALCTELLSEAVVNL